MNSKNVLVAIFAFFGISGLFMTLCILCISGIAGMFCWPYVINSWLIFAGKPIVVVWWQGFLMGMIPKFGRFAIPSAIATWIVLMFL